MKRFKKLLCVFFNHAWYVGSYGKRKILTCTNCRELGKVIK